MTHTITAADVRALRSATGIIFRTRHGESQVECLDRHDIGEVAERLLVIPAEARITDYGREYTSMTPVDQIDAFHYEMTPQFSDTARTLVRQISAGDSLILHWIRDNNSGLAEEFGLHQDELELKIRKKAGPTETYRVRTTINRDNSARMVRVVA